MLNTWDKLHTYILVCNICLTRREKVSTLRRHRTKAVANIFCGSSIGEYYSECYSSIKLTILLPLLCLSFRFFPIVPLLKNYVIYSNLKRFKYETGLHNLTDFWNLNYLCIKRVKFTIVTKWEENGVILLLEWKGKTCIHIWCAWGLFWPSMPQCHYCGHSVPLRCFRYRKYQNLSITLPYVISI